MADAPDAGVAFYPLSIPVFIDAGSGTDADRVAGIAIGVAFQGRSLVYLVANQMAASGPVWVAETEIERAHIKKPG